LRTPIVTRVTLPNLHWFGFLGSSAYLEALLPWLTAPLLKRLRINFSYQMIYSIPHLRQFMNTARNVHIKTVTLYFEENYLWVLAYPHIGARIQNLDMTFGCIRLDWQIVSAAQIFHALSTAFSVVEHLTLNYNRLHMSPEWNIEADRVHWRTLLGPFVKVKNLSVAGGLVKQLSGALQPGEEESPTELLPELQKLSHSARGDLRNAFTQFVNARQKAGRPVTVIHS